MMKGRLLPSVELQRSERLKQDFNRCKIRCLSDWVQIQGQNQVLCQGEAGAFMYLPMMGVRKNPTRGERHQMRVMCRWLTFSVFFFKCAISRLSFMLKLESIKNQLPRSRGEWATQKPSLLRTRTQCPSLPPKSKIFSFYFRGRPSITFYKCWVPRDDGKV